MEVWVLSAKPGGITLSAADAPQPYTARGDHFNSSGATMADFAEYLEGFGIVGGPVLDETSTDQVYEIDFSFDPENPDSFTQRLAEMGLMVKKETREIDILVLSPPE